MLRGSTEREAANGGGPRARVQSAARMLHIFHQLVRYPEGKQLSEISRWVQLPEVTTLRLLQTLVREGIVRKDLERGRYRLSPHFWLTAVSAFPDVSDTQRQLRLVLAQLAQRTTAHVALAVPYVGLRTMGVVATVPPEKTAPASLLAENNYPMHAMAAGKCYLASLTDEALQEWVAHPLPRVTGRTCTRSEKLLAEVRQARLDGYAVEREECTPGVWGIAVPVSDVSGALAGALQLCGPIATMSEGAVRQWLPPLQRVARSLSDAFSSLARLR